MILIMSFNPTWHMNTVQSSLTRLQAGDSGWYMGSPFWKNVLAGLATTTAAIWT